MARVLLFGRLGDLAGWRERTFEPAPDSLDGLRGGLLRVGWRGCMVVVTLVLVVALLRVAHERIGRVRGRGLVGLRGVIAAEDAALGQALVDVQVAVDLAIVRGDAPLRPDAEVAFLPPMSGG